MKRGKLLLRTLAGGVLLALFASDRAGADTYSTFDPFDVEEPSVILTELDAIRGSISRSTAFAGFSYTDRDDFIDDTASEETFLYYVGYQVRIVESLAVGVSVPYEDLEFKDDSGTYTEEGFSDIITYLAYTVPPVLKVDPSITAFVYWPSGDYEKGLGTGEFSYGASLDLTRAFGKFSAGLHGSYTFVEDPKGASLDDTALYGADVTYALNNKLAAQLSFEAFETELLNREEADAIQVGGKLFYFPTPELGVTIGYTQETEPTTAIIPNAAVYYHF